MDWATLRAGSVWPAVIGHAVLNGLAPIGSLLVTGNANPILAPTPAGILGSAAFALVGLLLLFGFPTNLVYGALR